MGTPKVDVCRQIGVSEATYYTWKKKYGDLGVTELRQLKMLEDKNAGLKRIVADLTQDKQILQDVVKKNLGRLSSGASRRPGGNSSSRLYVSRSCRLALLQPSVWYKKSEARDQSALRLRIREIVMNRPRFGYLLVPVMFNREG